MQWAGSAGLAPSDHTGQSDSAVVADFSQEKVEPGDESERLQKSVFRRLWNNSTAYMGIWAIEEEVSKEPDNETLVDLDSLFGWYNADNEGHYEPAHTTPEQDKELKACHAAVLRIH